MMYRSVSIRVVSEIHAKAMWCLFSFEICVQAQYLTGCLEKFFSRPPVMWRQEWHENEYAQTATTLISMMIEPSPMPKSPFGPRNACVTSQVSRIAIRNAA